MQILSILLISLLSYFEPVWLNDLNQAKTEANTSHKYILLNFSGSDWCVPCIRMEKEVFHSKAFEDFAATNLVLVNADFPRLKKHQLSKEQTRRNESLAEQYNPEGHFPLTLLLDAEGRVIKKWDGYTNTTPEKFLGDVNSSLHASH